MKREAILNKLDKVIKQTKANLQKLDDLAEKLGLRIDSRKNENIRLAINEQFKDYYRIYVDYGYSQKLNDIANAVFWDIRAEKNRLLKDFNISQIYQDKIKIKNRTYASHRTAWAYFFKYNVEESKVIQRYQNGSVDISVTKEEHKALIDLFYHTNETTQKAIKAIKKHFPDYKYTKKDGVWRLSGFIRDLEDKENSSYPRQELNWNLLEKELA